MDCSHSGPRFQPPPHHIVVFLLTSDSAKLIILLAGTPEIFSAHAGVFGDCPQTETDLPKSGSPAFTL